jgi:anti-sigma B factor antagonist
LDLSGLTFCDSSGIGAFVGMSTMLARLDGHLILMRPSDDLARRLRLTGIDRIIPVRDSLDIT